MKVTMDKTLWQNRMQDTMNVFLYSEFWQMKYYLEMPVVVMNIEKGKTHCRTKI